MLETTKIAINYDDDNYHAIPFDKNDRRGVMHAKKMFPEIYAMALAEVIGKKETSTNTNANAYVKKYESLLDQLEDNEEYMFILEEVLGVSINSISTISKASTIIDSICEKSFIENALKDFVARSKKEVSEIDTAYSSSGDMKEKEKLEYLRSMKVEEFNLVKENINTFWNFLKSLRDVIQQYKSKNLQSKPSYSSLGDKSQTVIDRFFSLIEESIQTSGSVPDTYGELLEVGDLAYYLGGQVSAPALGRSWDSYLSISAEYPQVAELFVFLQGNSDPFNTLKPQDISTILTNVLKSASSTDINSTVQEYPEQGILKPETAKQLLETLHLTLKDLEDIINKLSKLEKGSERTKDIDVVKVLGFIQGSEPEYWEYVQDISILKRDLSKGSDLTPQQRAELENEIKYLEKLQEEFEDSDATWVLVEEVDSETSRSKRKFITKGLVVSYLLLKYYPEESEKSAELRIQYAQQNFRLEKEGRLLDFLFHYSS
jgi:hypothetical protein